MNPPYSRGRAPCTSPRLNASRRSSRACATSSAPKYRSPPPSRKASSSAPAPCPGNPYDGHTLADALDQVEVLTDIRPSLAVLDRGYRGGPWRDAHPRADQRLAQRHYAHAGETPATTKRHRGRDRAHENRRSTDPLPTQGNDRQCDLCRSLRLPPQHPILAHLRAILALFIAAILRSFAQHPAGQLTPEAA